MQAPVAYRRTVWKPSFRWKAEDYQTKLLQASYCYCDVVCGSDGVNDDSVMVELLRIW